jgi:UDP-N-acetylmuramate dehydrogenase
MPPAPPAPAPRAAATWDELRASLSPQLLARVDVRLDEPLWRHTTNRLGGPADVWARPHDEDALAALLAAAARLQLPTTFIGAGSNLLVRDGGVRGLVIHPGALDQVTLRDPQGGPFAPGGPAVMHVHAGASTGRVLQRATHAELGGVEFLGGVPGSIGGGLVMNAGTYLGEFTDVVAQVRSLAPGGLVVTRAHAACGFRYRASDLPPTEVVVACELRLGHRNRAAIEHDVRELRDRRRSREPSGVATNGSTFKNPPGDYAGRLIEAAGLKGTRIGACEVSPKHANWLVVHRDGAAPPRARDMLALIERTRGEVEAQFGVRLELEVKVLGEPGDGALLAPAGRGAPLAAGGD